MLVVEVVGSEPTSKRTSIKRTTCVALNFRLKAKTIKLHQLSSSVILKRHSRLLARLLKVETDLLPHLFLLAVASATLRLKLIKQLERSRNR